MAIQIGGTTVIDNSRNITNVGIITVGTGGTTGTLQVGTGATIFGSGNVSIAGTLYALDISVPLKIDAFDPAHLATNISVSSDIKVYFNKAVGVGTTGFVELKTNSGVFIERFNVGAPSTQISFIDGSRTLVINPTGIFAKSSPGVANTIFTVITKQFINDASFTGVNTSTAVGAGSSYKFSTEAIGLGQTYEGGFLMCTAGGVQWIVSPYSAEVSRNGSSVDDANTRAQSVSGCTGWFVPTSAQLQNPGYICRSFWGPSPCYSSATYYSSNEFQPGYRRAGVHFLDGNVMASGISPQLPSVFCVRAFRCVTY